MMKKSLKKISPKGLLSKSESRSALKRMYKEMKKGILFVSLAVLGACDAILDVRPFDAIPAETAIRDFRGLQSAMNGVYDGLQSSSHTVQYTVITDLAADNITTNGSKIEYVTIENFNSFATNVYYNGIWNNLYDVINRVNNLLVAIPNVEGVSDNQKRRFEGEALVVRAYCYHNLVRFFGGVPYRDQPVTGATPEDIFIGRSTPEFIYQKIEEDLISAMELLAGNGRGQSFRANEGAAYALMARVKLYQRQWAEAANFAEQVINEFGYALQTGNYASIFTDPLSSPEIIFQIDFKNDTDVNLITNWVLPAGRFEVAATADLFNAFTANDARRNESVGQQGAQFFVNKFRDLVTEQDNHIVLRLAEMHLIAAEALNEVSFSASGRAFDHLNAIRARAGLSTVDGNDLINQQAFRLAVELERRRELCFEGHRFFDLVRTNRTQAVLGLNDPNKHLFPIPQTELDANGHPDMIQNPGYN
jgi:starch-binding outer membrane protein, SusD/RagB family